MTDKSGTRVGHLNTILARVGGEFERSNLQKFKCPGGCPGGMLKFRIDRRICQTIIIVFLMIKQNKIPTDFSVLELYFFCRGTRCIRDDMDASTRRKVA